MTVPRSLVVATLTPSPISRRDVEPAAIAPSPTAAAVSIVVPKLTAPEPMYRRSPELRKPLVEARGGTPESEGAVERGLAFLARHQEPDGRFPASVEEGRAGHRPRRPHDMACTGLGALAFLAADHTPAREGPYRQNITTALDWLVAQQGEDGDLRGPKGMSGAGADRGNMYDHGICTMALAEAGLMTGDRRYVDAAYKAAQFIVDGQDPRAGGWRYLPREAGDTSVLGWQVLALHDAEQLGFQTPPIVRERALHFLSIVAQGHNRILSGYLPGDGTKPSMTAEALFSRMLLGEPISDAAAEEVSRYLTADLPNRNNADWYFWYYASLSLSQLRDVKGQAGTAWQTWNARTRDTLVALQKRGGAADGSWAGGRYSDRGPIFSTSLATLTLEVYYRYLPLQPTGTLPPPPGVATGATARPVTPAPRQAERPTPRPMLEPN